MDRGELAEMSRESERDQTRRKHLISLFTYLREASRLRFKPVLDVGTYEQVIWLGNLSGLPGCTTESDDPEFDCWLEIRRTRPPAPPQVPSVIEPWLKTSDPANWRSIPDLRSQAVIAVEHTRADGSVVTEPTVVSIDDRPDIRDAYERYLEVWLEWADERQTLEPALDAYAELFRASQRVATLGEQYEVVVADCLLRWPIPGHQIRRHLITIPARIEYEESTGTIRIVPAEMAVTVNPSLEQDMVPPEHRPGREVADSVDNALAMSASPSDEYSRRAGEQWVLGASAEGLFDPSPDDDSPAESAPIVTMEPAVIIRRRTHRSLEQIYQSMIEQLEAGDDIPEPTVDLVEATGGAIAGDPESSTADVLPPPDAQVFFPLPANEQQVRIVEELQHRPHVVVQGPPGTGKSHTIANLISHALATGQRVLVTSHTERALRVLQEKLPDDIRALTVSVLGSGKEGAADLQRSAATLLSRMSDKAWSRSKADDRISLIEADIEKSRVERSRILARLTRLREGLTEPSFLDSGYRGTLGEIAEKLASERSNLGWIEDEISGPMPLEVEEFQELHQLSRELRDKPEVGFAPSPVDLPSPSEYEELVQAAVRARTGLGGLPGDRNTAQRLAGDPLPSISMAVQSYFAARSAAERRPEPWIGEALKALDDGRFLTWQNLLELSRDFISRDSLHNHQAISASATRSTSWRSHVAPLRTLVHHLASGGKLRQFVGTPKVVKAAQPALSVLAEHGVVITNRYEAEAALALVEELADLAELEAHWGERLPESRSTLALRRTELREHVSAIEHVEAVANARVSVDESAGHLVGDEIDTHADVVAVAELVALAEATTAAEEAEARLERLANIALTAWDPAPAADREKVRQALQTEDVHHYRRLFNEAGSRHELHTKWRRSRELFESLRLAAPLLATRVVHDPDPSWINDVLRAWNWAWAETELLRLESEPASLLDEKLRGLERRMADLVAELSTAKAWQHALANISPYEAQELKAYQTALRALGKGTGKRAVTQRAAAREHLDNCRTAIPAWIMPTYRVAETIGADPGSFDLVIVDEASQSGPDAMFLFWLGRQTIIVGDDFQISPTTVGITADAIESLRQRHLSGVPLADLLDFEQSLFDQARVRFHGEIWLTEHFRCMPEIIEFSNRLLYAPNHTPLVPLRQFGTDRLTPLRRTHVPDGHNTGSSANAVNRAEVDAIVDAIVQSHKDPAYDGLTFGVISLLGSTQARLIEQHLLSRLDPDAWVSRNLRCGDAYDFQGDERDVIFISMVRTVQPNQPRIPKLGHRRYEQRYNVAASRARDQAWLFHSMTLDQLHPECVRHRLLNHFTQPPILDVQPFEEPVSNDTPMRPFESLFEQRVFNEIASRGYAVQPQFEAYGRRIDLVVAGSGGKLAVECDGSHWHGAEQFARDLDRQQALERAGWTFFRVTDIDYYLDQDEALEPLWQILQDSGIYPIGQAASPHAKVLDVDVAERPAARSSDQTRAEAIKPSTPREHVDRPQSPVQGSLTETRPETHSERLAPQPTSGREPIDAPEQSTFFDTAIFDGLVPYTAWKPRPLSSPNMVSSKVLAKAIVDFVSAEGPVVVERVFQELNTAAGNERLGKNLRSAFVYALREATSRDQLIKTNPLGENDVLSATVALPGQKATPRQLGPRKSLDHVPPAELAAASMLASVSTLDDEEKLRALLSLYGMSRLSRSVEERLRRCVRLAAE